MAPKRKKKAVTNPNRGVATTSLPSKARTKLEEEQKAEAEAKRLEEEKAMALKVEEATETAHNTDGGVPAMLSPEEYARQLEESELQVFFDGNKEKVHRDAKRVVLKLDTEKRTVRNVQSSSGAALNVNRWMDEKIISEIFDMASTERAAARADGTDPVTVAAAALGSEAYAMKLWEIEVILQGLGFTAKQARAVTEEGIIDIDEALVWLGMHYDEGDMPSFLSSRKRMNLKNGGGGGSSQASPGPSGASTPLLPQTPSKTKRLELGGLDSSISKLAVSPRFPSKYRYSSSSESDDAPEPEELIKKWIVSKKKLFKLTGDEGVPGGKKKKGKKLAGEIKDPARVAYYEAKLAKLESDPLFNKHDAAVCWTEEVQKLKDKIISRLKAGLTAHSSDEEDGGVKLDLAAPAVVVSKPTDDKDDDDDDNDDDTSAAQKEKLSSSASSITNVESTNVRDDGGDEGGLLGEMFEDMPESEQIADDRGRSVTVTIRDFTKAGEPHALAKKVFEEAIRNKFRGAKVQYVEVSAGKSRSSRYQVSVTGTDVELPAGVTTTDSDSDEAPSKSYTITSTESAETLMRTVTIESRTVACNTSAQACNYISTLALFKFFGDSRLYLRLGPVWKDLWTELEEEQKAEEEEREKMQVKSIRSLIEDMRGEDWDMPTNGSSSPTKKSKAANGTNTIERQYHSVDRSYDPMIQQHWEEKTSTFEYAEMMMGRRQLPMYSFKQQILETISSNKITIVCGSTGCGKSTQVPAFLLEQSMAEGKPCKIYVTEPRRISAISLARRVAAELGENPQFLGTRKSLVGYSIRLEAKHNPQTRLIYATTGILMRMLESPKEIGQLTHLVLDEVHERSIESDFLLIVLKKLIQSMPDLRIVLMSATMDAQKFSSYLGDAPVLNVPGRTFPVQTLYLEDAIELTGFILEDNARGKGRYNDEEDDGFEEANSKGNRANSTISLLEQHYSQRTRDTIRRMDETTINYELVAELLAKISSDERYADYSKAVLIFAPGIQEIKKIKEAIEGHHFFTQDDQQTLIYPLHSSIPSEEQEAAFIVPRPGIQKIVLATDIAETGITIPDITCVIDTGKHKEMRFSERQQLSRLVETFISKANAKQRRGRAGRVQEGLCFHLFTKERADQWLADQQPPEMLRLALQDLVLRVKICQLGNIEEVLASALDPPLPKNVRRAIDALVEVRALTPSSEELTALGRQLAKLPVDVHLGKLLIMSYIHECLDVAVTIAAIISSKSPFIVPFGKRQEADKARYEFKRGDSDLLTQYNAYETWRRVSISKSMNIHEFCRKNYISHQNLSAIEDLKLQLYVNLADAGFLSCMESADWLSLNRARFTSYGGNRRNWFEPPASLNVNCKNDDVINAVICASFYPKLLVAEGKGWRNVMNTQRISIHPSSVNRDFKGSWLSYDRIMQSNRVYNAHETSRAEDIAIALLCGDAEFKLFAGILLIDGSNRIRFTFENWKGMLAVRILRKRIKEITASSWKDPEQLWTDSEMRWRNILKAVLTRPPPKPSKK